MDKHIDMNEEIREIVENREQNLLHRGICQGDLKALKELKTNSVYDMFEGGVEEEDVLEDWGPPVDLSDNPAAIAWESLQKCASENQEHNRETPFGERQVESFLRFMISAEIEREFEDAEGDNIVYDALGSHRILGKAKKKKKKRSMSY